ncbi:ubiquitin-like protein Pup [Streptomyces sp. NPDC005065]|uniref:ubiquitin-like protein Pup n=1 Tax=Streptomyces sp. NPDC005065 TaxID=3154461 RepID=UPI0033A68A0B
MQHQEEHRRHEDSREEDASAEAGDQPAVTDSKVSSDAAEVLDDIDDVLNEIENPQEWVAGFVQKGGQ